MASSIKANFIKFLRRPTNQIIADVVPLLTAVYFTIKKLWDTSIEHVLDQWFKDGFTTFILGLLIAIIIYSCLVKTGLIIIDKISSLTGFNIDLSALSYILRTINAEIAQHITDISNVSFNKSVFSTFHPYNENINLVITDLQKNIVNAFKKQNLGDKDVFISYYHHPAGEIPSKKLDELEYLVHVDESCCDVETKKLSAAEPAHRDYLGIKAFSRSHVIYEAKADKKNYIKDDCDRRKTIKHYFGVPLVVKDRCIGIINIEIHNKPVFDDKQAMEAFYKNVIYSFRCQFEYQLHKRVFFKLIESKLAS